MPCSAELQRLSRTGEAYGTDERWGEMLGTLRRAESFDEIVNEAIELAEGLKGMSDLAMHM